MAKNYYDILGISRTATEREIKAAYHRLARKTHPDKADEGADAARMEAEFAAISTAYNTLKDVEKRGAYDQTLDRLAQAEAAAGAGSGAGGRGRTAQAAGASPSSGGASGGDKAPPGAVDKSRASVARRAFLRGLQHMTQGDYARSAEFFEQAIKNNDGDATYHSKLAQTLLRGKRSFSRATEAAQRAVELDPYNSDHRLILAEVYESAGITSKAVQTYEEILRWDPTNERAARALHELQPKKKSLFSRLFGKNS